MVTVSRIAMCLVLPSGAGFCPSTVPVGPVFKLIECSALAPHSSKKKSKVPDRSCVAQDEIYKQFCLEQNDLETSISCLPGGPIDLTFLPDIERSSFHNPNKKNTHVLNNCQVCIHTSYLTNLRVYHGNPASKKCAFRSSWTLRIPFAISLFWVCKTKHPVLLASLHTFRISQASTIESWNFHGPLRVS